MSEQEQIIYMQARILQMIADRRDLNRKQALDLFKEYDIAGFIEANFDIFHMEGDECVFDEVERYLESKGDDR